MGCSTSNEVWVGVALLVTLMRHGLLKECGIRHDDVNLRANKVGAMKWSLPAKENIFVKAKRESMAATRASFRVARVVDKVGKPLAGGEITKSCMT